MRIVLYISSFIFSIILSFSTLLGQSREYKNIKYAGASDMETLDIYVPQSENKRLPLIALIGNEQWSLNIIPQCISRGYVVANINYRNGSDVLFPAQIQDLQAALKWLKANSDRYNFDSDKIILCGSGEGGYLSALTAAIESYEDGVMAQIEFGANPESFKAQNALQKNVNWINLFSIYPGSNYISNTRIVHEKPKIAGVIDFYGYAYNTRGIDMLNSELNAKEANTQTAVEQYLTPCTPPMMFIYGENDKITPLGIGENLYNKLRTILCPPGTKDCLVKFMIVSNGVHGGIQYEAEYIYNSMFSFIESIVK